ncbi:MAG: beta-ketoacyl-ACP synthase II [Chloroflexi bacterium]|nr:beta-ketoacyl-ACP synthase II [Chloroflexota bacterium]
MTFAADDIGGRKSGQVQSASTAITRESGHRHRVVITGMGAVTPLGNDVEEYWRKLRDGVSGIAPITQFDTTGYPTTIAGEVKGFNAGDYLDAKEARRMSRVIQLAVAATREAIEQSGLKVTEANCHDVGVIIGSGIGSLTSSDRECRVMLDKGGMRINPFFLPMMLPNMASAQVSRIFGLRGYNTTVVTACASGGHSIGEAAEVIRRGAAQVMITGGAEASICELGLASFCVIRALSQRNDEPQKASRPFDLHRDGFVPAEGAGVVVLESLEHALRRDAPILAELVGYAGTCDAYHVVAPEPEATGIAEAMRRALADAGLQPADVSYVNAHATSTSVGDVAETVGIKRIFGELAYRVPVSATKSMTGHSIGAAGGIELIACVLSMRDGVVHPTTNYEMPDPECDLDYVPNILRKIDVEVAMSNSFGFGGQNACLIVRRYRSSY